LTSLSKLPDILNQARLSKIGKQRNSLEGGVNSILGVEDPETTKAKQDFRERVTKFDRNEALSRGGLQTFLSETKALPTALQDNREEASKILNRIEKNGDNSLSGAQTKLKDKDKKEAILKLITSRSIEEQKTGWRELQLPEEQIKKIYDKNVSASKKADESNQKMTLSVNKKDISLDHTIFSANQARVNSEDKGEVLKLLKDAGLTSAELSGFEEKALADLANQLKENKQINLAATPDTILAALKEIKGKSST